MSNDKKVLSCVFVGTPDLNNYGWKRIQIQNRESVDFESDLESIIATLIKLREKYSENYKNLSFRTSRDCGCYGDCNCGPTYYLAGDRLETDLEYNFRKKAEEKSRLEKEKRDLVEFERLKKIFAEGKSK